MKKRYVFALTVILFLAFSCRDEDYIIKNESIEVTGGTEDHDDPEDYIWDSTTVIPIILSGNSIQVDSPCVIVNGSLATIAAPGTYHISGTLTDGQLVVNSPEEGIVRLIFGGTSINCSNSAPVYIQNASRVLISLEDSTENALSDGSSYVFDTDEDEPNAAIFSKEDLTIDGNGSLTVHGNYNDGIASKDGLLIKSGTLSITAADDGIRGKDYLIVEDGSITINAGGDGMKSDNDEDASEGYIMIGRGTFNITAGGDAIQALADVDITDGEFILSSGGGSGGYAVSSAKGIKAGDNLTIQAGDFTVNSADDAIHSNNTVDIYGGIISISSGDDGIHADYDLTVSGGEIDIARSYEGLESADADIYIYGGDIHIVSSDDGINIAGGGDTGFGGPGGPPGPPPDASSASAGNYYLYISGGNIVINADGDGLDVNGSVEMSDGSLVISGPTANNNGAMDYDGSFSISGGFLAAAGSSGMAQAPGGSSSQHSVLLTSRTTWAAGTLFHIQTSGGEELLSFAPAKKYSSVVFSSPGLVHGLGCEIYTSGSSTGTLVDNLYLEGDYTPGTHISSFTVSGTITQISQ
jgi:hypothetical protein